MPLLDLLTMKILRFSRERPKEFLTWCVILFCFAPVALLLFGFVWRVFAGIGALLGIANIMFLFITVSRYTLIPICTLFIAYLLRTHLPGTPDFLFYWVVTTDLVATVVFLRQIDKPEALEELLTKVHNMGSEEAR